MKRLWTIALLATLGCVEPVELPMHEAPVDADLSLLPDAFVCRDVAALSTCNPVTQAGCEAGEKCGQLAICDSPTVTMTACLPDGTTGVFEACERGPAGPLGYDDCESGLQCVEGRCLPICDQSPDTCSGNPFLGGIGARFQCNLINGLFVDTWGVCEERPRAPTDVGLGR